MHTFLTPDPVTLEIRNAAGQVHVNLVETQTTTVEVTTSTGHPLGFIDDFLKSFGSGRGIEGFVKGRQFGARGGFGEQPADIDPAAGEWATSTITDPAESVRVQHVEGDSPTVIIDTKSARDGWRSSFDITVTAPTGSSIRLQSKSSDLTVTGAARLADVRTASGNVRITEIRGKALLQSASGDISVEVAGGDIDVRTASGDVVVGPVGGSALVHTASGDIRVGANAGDITVRTVSGDVQVADAASGSTQINAVSGDVRIGIHSGSLAAVDLSTVSGTTRTDFEVADEITEGEAPLLQVKVKTTSGDIVLHRAA